MATANLSKRTIRAIIFNLLLPGAGYLYLKARNRTWIAIPLLLLSVYCVGYITFIFFTGSRYPYSMNLSPFTSTGLVNVTVYSWLTFVIISIDTYLVAKQKIIKS